MKTKGSALLNSAVCKSEIIITSIPMEDFPINFPSSEISFRSIQ